MMWPWSKPEKRSYTSIITDVLSEAALDSTTLAGQVSAVRIVASVVSRALMAATVEPDSRRTACLDALTRGRIGRRLIEDGEVLHELRVSAGRARLVPITEWERRDGWYFVTQGGQQRRVSAKAVLHIKWPGGPPWQGVSGELAAGIERQLRDESKQPSGTLLALPGPQDNDSANTSLLDKLRSLKGKRVALRTPASGWGDKMEAVPNLQETRLGLNPPQGLVALRQQCAEHLLSACGLPATFLSADATGESLREAGRHGLHWLVNPVGNLVSEACSVLLDTEVILNFDALFASDLRSRGQALKALVDSGVELSDALQKTGLA